MVSKEEEHYSSTSREIECASSSQSLNSIDSHRLNIRLPHSLKVILIVAFVITNLVTSILAVFSGIDHTKTQNTKIIPFLIGASNSTNTTT